MIPNYLDIESTLNKKTPANIFALYYCRQRSLLLQYRSPLAARKKNNPTFLT